MTFRDYGEPVCLHFILCAPTVENNYLLMLFSVLRGRDPSAVAVLMEDSASVAGVFLAASAIGLAQFTGNVIYDALGSITIGGRY